LGKKLPDGVLLCPDRRIASVTMLLTILLLNPRLFETKIQLEMQKPLIGTFKPRFTVAS